MAPIKIKLSLSSALIPSAANNSAQDIANTGESSQTPKKGNKVPQHARTGLPSHHAQLATPEAGPSRLRGDPLETNSSTPASRAPKEADGLSTPNTATSTPSRQPKSANTPSSSKSSKAKTKAKPKSAKKTKRPTAIPSHLLPSTPSTPKPPPPLPFHDSPSPGPSTVKQEDVEMYTGGSPSAEPEQINTPAGDGMDNEESGTPTTAQKQSVRWMRLKRPLRDHATKIVADLIKRDEVS